jgi:hypothetical protein
MSRQACLLGETSVFQNPQWDSNGIIATSSAGVCMTQTMMVSFAEKNIQMTHSMKELAEEQKKACNFFGAEKTAQDIFVLRGSDRWNREHTLLAPEK